MSLTDKPLAWLHGEVKTPPLSPNARLMAGYLLRRIQKGEALGMPDSRPMPRIGAGCHELRVDDGNLTWRIVYAITTDAIVILEVFAKKTRATPVSVIKACRKRLKEYRDACS